MKGEWVTKQTLLIRIKDKSDESAWDDFVLYYKSFIQSVICHLRVNRNDEDDITQEVLLKVWKNLQNFDYKPERAKLRTWLNTVIRNCVIDFSRKKKKDKKTQSINEEDFKTDLLPLSEDQFDIIIEKEWRKHVTSLALKNIESFFSGHAIEVFKLSLQNVDVDEISNKFKLSKSSVYTLRKRVEKKLIEEVTRLKEDIEF